MVGFVPELVYIVPLIMYSILWLLEACLMWEVFSGENRVNLNLVVICT